jgi:mannose-6-phosphate isomerase-like protein (cupin superfamily)
MLGWTSRGRTSPGADLAGADLAGADLAGADLAGADLADAAWAWRAASPLPRPDPRRVAIVVDQVPHPHRINPDHGRMEYEFDTMRLPGERDVAAPDGSDVRVLLQLGRGGMAQFELGAGRTSRAVAHHHVDEIWFIQGGRGEMWRRQGGRQETVPLVPGTCLSIPAGTHFQFRATGTDPLTAVALTMPPWPGPDEAYAVTGPWPADPIPPK